MIQAICPICGAPNECASVRGEDARECWCTRVKIPSELIQEVPETLIGVSCICRSCVERFHGNGDGGGKPNS